MGGHQQTRGRTESWITPPEILAALGTFDLDPCACVTQPWATAKRMIALPEDGLRTPWLAHERVWLNPPYGARVIRPWMNLMARQRRGTALIFARTETSWFRDYVWKYADAVLFIDGRLHFYLPDGTRAPENAGAPSCLVAYGHDDARILRYSGIKGAWCTGWRTNYVSAEVSNGLPKIEYGTATA